MSIPKIQNQSEPINPYSAPKGQASLGISKFLTLVVMGLVVAGFASAGTFAYWRLSTPDVSEEEAEIVFQRHAPD